ncbi:hypothetical protein V0288_15815 [Pannus brasiliensis CCIBt3594]|uniref:Uncharacterized protein n=1 Tax=Pannus brasiliensis CCIBt3594 TaxID=1427578 RepID=A0AAW9QZP2_9CHRO
MKNSDTFFLLLRATDGGGLELELTVAIESNWSGFHRKIPN